MTDKYGGLVAASGRISDFIKRMKSGGKIFCKW